MNQISVLSIKKYRQISRNGIRMQAGGDGAFRFLLIISGKGSFVVDEKEVALSEGFYLFLAPDHDASLLMQTSSELTILDVSFSVHDPLFCGDCLRIPASGIVNDEIQRFVELARFHWKSDKPHSREVAALLMASALLILCDGAEEDPPGVFFPEKGNTVGPVPGGA